MTYCDTFDEQGWCEHAEHMGGYGRDEGVIMPAMLTDEEYETHVVPLSAENWTDYHGHYPETAADWSDMLIWARSLREQYDEGSMEITWR